MRQARSTQRYQPRCRDDEERLTARVVELASLYGRWGYRRIDLPPIVVPFLMRVLEPWTKGEAERSPEAMVLSFQVLEACSPVSCAA